jgi:glycosyltransferase involved in cell wall biosynthesis
MSDTRLTISVITPCYNGGRFLHATIESVLRQTYLPIEMIIVDDGSTVDSAAFAESFGAPVRLIRQQNQGESVARNVAIEAARGDYLQFLDADDLLAKDAIEQKVKAIGDLRGAVAISRIAFFEKDPTQPIGHTELSPDSFFPHIIRTNFGAPHAWLVPRELVKNAGGFDASLRWFEDWELWCRVALLEPKLIAIPHIGALYRQHPHSQLATTKDADRARGHAAVVGRLGERMLTHPELLKLHGDSLFWALWTSIRRAREKGVSWTELDPVARVLVKLAQDGPANFRNGRFARLIRLVGIRWASRVHGLFNRQSSWQAQAATV